MNPSGNVRRIGWLNFFWMFLVTMPVLIPFFQARGLSMRHVFFLTSTFSIATVLLELPSGYLADLIGHRRCLILAGILNGVSVFLLAISQTFWQLVIYELVMAVGVSLFSGTDVALLYASLPENDQALHMRHLGNRMFFSQIGEMTAALLGGFLARWSLDLPAYVHAVTAWLPLLLALGLREPSQARLPRHSHVDNLRVIFRHTLAGASGLRLVFANIALYSALLNLGAWSSQGYWQHIGIDARYFGLLWGANGLVVALIGRYAHHLERFLGFSRACVSMALLPAFAFALEAVTGAGYGCLFGFGFHVSRGLNQVMVRDRINRQVPAQVRATANSLATAGGKLLFAVTGPVLGFGIDTLGYPPTFLIASVVALTAALLVTTPLLRSR